MTKNYKCVIPPEVSEYIAIVRSEEYLVCKDQLLFCDLVEKSFREDEIYIDYKRLEKYLSYEKYFPFKLFPWEKCLFTLHCCTFWLSARSRAVKWPLWMLSMLWIPSMPPLLV